VFGFSRRRKSRRILADRKKAHEWLQLVADSIVAYQTSREFYVSKENWFGRQELESVNVYDESYGSFANKRLV